MRINRYIALATGLGRRKADDLIALNRVTVNGEPATSGRDITDVDTVMIDGRPINASSPSRTIMLHKPAGYVVSRDGQGSRTVYDLLSPELHRLKPVGRLDKDSSGLLLLTNDGQLAEQLTHPRYAKQKVYEVQLNKILASPDLARLHNGVMLEDGMSKLKLDTTGNGNYRVTMTEGRNRQIRRTFSAVGYDVKTLHRTQFGPYKLGNLPAGKYNEIS